MKAARSESLIEEINDWRNEGINEREKKQHIEWSKEWIYEWINEWTNAWMGGWMDGWNGMKWNGTEWKEWNEWMEWMIIASLRRKDRMCIATQPRAVTMVSEILRSTWVYRCWHVVSSQSERTSGTCQQDNNLIQSHLWYCTVVTNQRSSRERMLPIRVSNSLRFHSQLLLVKSASTWNNRFNRICHNKGA